jgi:DNA-directed RNA polymerase specialized sigma24 family protein
VLRLHYFEGCTVGEIAQALELNTVYVRKLLTKCHRRAERTLTEDGKGKER